MISKLRDMVLCRFPEVDMVVGKAGRAETPTDPAPLDMIESMVSFRPQVLWPRCKLRLADAMQQGEAVCRTLIERGVIRAPESAENFTRLVELAVENALPYFDTASREYAYHRNQEMLRDTAGLSPTSNSPANAEESRLLARWRLLRRSLTASFIRGRRRYSRASCWSSFSTTPRFLILPCRPIAKPRSN